MDNLGTTFFKAGDAIAELLEHPETARLWEEPSALRGMTVGGLAAHLSHGVKSIDRLLDAPEPSDAPVVGLGEFIASFKMEEFDADLPRYLRDVGERTAKHGHSETLKRFRELLAKLQDTLPDYSGNRLLDMRPVLPWAVPLEDRIRLQVIEFVVHGDDLAVSLGCDGAEVPEAAWAVAIDALIAAARFRHGDRAVIRTLSRKERSAAGIFPIL
jgi:hypothetical protein